MKAMSVWQSFIYRVNSTGDITQPWGAPVFVINALDEFSLKTTYWGLLLKTSRT